MIANEIASKKRAQTALVGRQEPGGRRLSLAAQVAGDLERQMDDGTLEPGDRLPLCNDLCRQYGVSLITVRGALASLTAQGRIESRWRGGIYVKANSDVKQMESTKTISLVAELASNPFSAGILAGAVEAASSAGYQVILSATKDDPEVEAAQIHDLASRVDGTLVVPVNHTDSHAAAFEQLVDNNRPLVFVDHYIEGIDAPRVTSDNVRGGYLATEHLLEQGCKRVYALTSGRHSTSSRERLQGHMLALQAHGHLFDPSLICHSPDIHYQAGQDLTREILHRERGTQKLGIFAINDVLAAGAYISIKQAGLRIPEDVAVVGYDDVHAATMDPPLTSIRQDLSEMGRRAVRLLLSLKHGKTAASELVPVELIVRSSTIGRINESSDRA